MELVWKIGGEAGAGANVTGRILGRAFSRGGLNVIGYPEYPSLIRGGHNTYQIRVSDGEIYSPKRKSDLIVALNKAAVVFHHEFIGDGGALIYDSTIDISGFNIRKDVHLYPVPFDQVAAESGGDARMRNTVSLGATLALIGYPMEMLTGVLHDEFIRKGEEVVKKNVAVAQAGYDYVMKNFDVSAFPKKISVLDKKKGKKLFVGGNEAAGMGAIAAGMKFFAAYPMTPASTLMHYIASKEYDYGIVMKHTEDEISAVGYAIGAAFAGARSMTSTSGGGFSLMVESLGLAAEAEVPLVIYLAQRVGPSTNMPTWTEQADLRFAVHASQGEFLRVIIAPGDVEESFYLTAEAFNFAEKYHIPVIVMSDKFLGETHFSVDRFNEKKVKIERGAVATALPALAPNERFKRYAFTENGVSPRVFPGTPNGNHVATSYEHDESGFSSEEFAMRKAMVDKRMRKLPSILAEIGKPKIYGNRRAKIVLVGWGSQKLPILDAVKELEEKGIKVKFVHFNYVYPIDRAAVRTAFWGAQKIIAIENNRTAQFAGMLKEYGDVEADFKLLKYDGRQFFADEIVEHVKRLVDAGFTGEKEILIEEKDYEYYSPWKVGL